MSARGHAWESCWPPDPAWPSAVAEDVAVGVDDGVGDPATAGVDVAAAGVDGPAAGAEWWLLTELTLALGLAPPLPSVPFRVHTITPSTAIPAARAITLRRQ
jgi:hypothetical protein